MIKAINFGRTMNYGFNTSINKSENKSGQNNQDRTEICGKTYAKACENNALASLNLTKAHNVSFKGQKLDSLPDDWFFDLDGYCIKTNYGYDVDLDKVPDRVRADEKQRVLINKALFKGFISNGTRKHIPFYRYMPANNMYCPAGAFNSDGYVKVSEKGEIEYISEAEALEK